MGGPLNFPVSSAGNTGQPLLIWDMDWTTEATQSLDGVSSLGGLSITEASSGSPAAWQIRLGVGIELTGTSESNGTIRVDWADIGSDLMERTLTDADCVVFVTQFNAALGTATVQFTQGQFEVADTGNDNLSLCSVLKEGSNNRRAAYWGGGPSLTYAVRDNLTDVRSVALWMPAGGTTSVSWWSTSAVGTSAPVQAGTEYRISGDLSRAGSGAGAWTKTTSGSWGVWSLTRKASETVATVIERSQIWLIPGSANS